MKYSAIILAAAAGVVSAISIGDFVPKCSLDCLTNAISTGTKCALTDPVCQCQVENYQNIYVVGTTCVINACGSDVAISMLLFLLPPPNTSV